MVLWKSLKLKTVKDAIKDGIPARYSMAILAFFGFVFNYMLRINISIAIVAMVNQSAITEHSNHGQLTTPDAQLVHLKSNIHECGPRRLPRLPLSAIYNSNSSIFTDINPQLNNSSTHDEDEEGEFIWNEKMQAIIIGSFFWGYIITQFPGGRLAELFGAKYIFGFSILLAGIVNILIPFAANNNPIYIIILRVLLGVFEGATYPAMHAMLARWAPPEERSRLSSIIYSGSQAGTIIAFPLAGFLINSWGWRSVFFVMGLGSFVWCVIWMIFAHDSPEVHPRISAKEKEMFRQVSVSSGKRCMKESIPWKCILTSMPFWAIVVCSICSGWGFWTFLHELPTYLKNILGFDIKKNSLLSALPYAVMWIFGLVYSIVADRLRRSSCMTTGLIRKISSFVCLFLPGCCILIITFVGCDPVATVVLLTIAIGFSGAKYSAYLTNHIDISPNFAGTLLGLANALATFPGWLAPLVAGSLTSGQQTLDRWHIVFYLATGVYTFGCIFYCIFASGEVQPWNQLVMLDDANVSSEKKSEEDSNNKEATLKKSAYGSTASAVTFLSLESESGSSSNFEKNLSISHS